MFRSYRSAVKYTLTGLIIVLMGGLDQSSLFATKPIPSSSIRKHCDWLKSQFYENRDKAREADRKFKKTRKRAYRNAAYNYKREAIYFKKRYRMECEKQAKPPEGRRYPGNCTPKARERVGNCVLYAWQWESNMGRNRSCEDPEFRRRNPKECKKKCTCVKRR